MARIVRLSTPLTLLLLAIAWLMPATVCAAERTLAWDALEVEAVLAADGRLSVLERQHMVFTGYWNGGERSFRLRPGQTVALGSITRLDPATGDRRQLVRGSLDLLDHYNWHDRTTLRWRSRLTTDPPFADTRITYELRYTLAHILVPEQGLYLLDHDFAFPERQWPIKRFSLALTLDPNWQAPSSFTGKIEHGALAPGESVVLAVALRTRDGRVPASLAVRPAAAKVRPSPGTPALVRHGLLALAALVLIAGLIRFVRHEKEAGRFVPLLAPGRIDNAWLTEHIFSRPPEVVGAAWDKTTGASEVAAVIARLVQEGKMASELRTQKIVFFFKKSVLSLRLLVDRATFTSYERALVDALFFAGDETDTEAIAKHYESKGLDPAATIRDGIDSKVKMLTRQLRHPLQWTWLRPLVLTVAALHILVVGGIIYRGEFIPALVMTALCVVLLIAALILAHFQTISVDGLYGRITLFTLPLVAILALDGWLLLQDGVKASLWLAGGMTLLSAAFFDGLFLFAKTRESQEEVALRKELAAGRRYLARELKKATPDLKDEWIPYLLAFGLGPAVERWFRSFGTSAGGGDSGMGGSVGGGSSTAGWSGGGGTFGGGGASGSWAAAVGSMAGGVSSSSSGGGSSGGGGGGGW